LVRQVRLVWMEQSARLVPLALRVRTALSVRLVRQERLVPMESMEPTVLTVRSARSAQPELTVLSVRWVR
jgi:hypothetical protein